MSLGGVSLRGDTDGWHRGVALGLSLGECRCVVTLPAVTGATTGATTGGAATAAASGLACVEREGGGGGGAAPAAREAPPRQVAPARRLRPGLTSAAGAGGGCRCRASPGFILLILLLLHLHPPHPPPSSSASSPFILLTPAAAAASRRASGGCRLTASLPPPSPPLHTQARRSGAPQGSAFGDSAGDSRVPPNPLGGHRGRQERGRHLPRRQRVRRGEDVRAKGEAPQRPLSITSASPQCHRQPPR